MSLRLDLVMWFCTVYLVWVWEGLLAESDSKTIVKELVLHNIMHASCCRNNFAHIIDTQPRILHHEQQQWSQFRLNCVVLNLEHLHPLHLVNYTPLH